MIMTKGRSIIIRIYFALVAAVTLFTLMFGAIDFLTIGIKKIVPGADQPSWMESCTESSLRTMYPPVTDGKTPAITPEQMKADCEQRRADAIENYRREQAQQIARNIALLLVSIPLFAVHFRIVLRDWKEERA